MCLTSARRSRSRKLGRRCNTESIEVADDDDNGDESNSSGTCFFRLSNQPIVCEMILDVAPHSFASVLLFDNAEVVGFFGLVVMDDGCVRVIPSA